VFRRSSALWGWCGSSVLSLTAREGSLVLRARVSHVRSERAVVGSGPNAADLRWSADQGGGTQPVATVLGLSLWRCGLIMLAWALRSLNPVIGWLRDVDAVWPAGGYWRRREPKKVAPPQLPPATTPAPQEPPRHV